MKTDKLLSAYIMDPVINKKDKQGGETFFLIASFSNFVPNVFYIIC